TPKLPKPLPKALTRDERDKLLDYTWARSRNSLRGKRDNCIFHFFFFLRLRVSELTSLQFINIERGEEGRRAIRVFGKGNKERRLALNEKVTKALDDYLAARPETPHKYPFLALRGKTHQQRMSARTVQHMVKTYRAKGRLPDYFTPHKGRST